LFSGWGDLKRGEILGFEAFKESENKEEVWGESLIGSKNSERVEEGRV